MKINEVQEKLNALIAYSKHTGIQEGYIKVLEAASALIDGMIDMKENIEILTECSCPQHPMCNCCDDHACFILGDIVIGMINETLKKGDIEI